MLLIIADATNVHVFKGSMNKKAFFFFGGGGGGGGLRYSVVQSHSFFWNTFFFFFFFKFTCHSRTSGWMLFFVRSLSLDVPHSQSTVLMRKNGAFVYSFVWRWVWGFTWGVSSWSYRLLLNLLAEVCEPTYCYWHSCWERQRGFFFGGGGGGETLEVPFLLSL